MMKREYVKPVFVAERYEFKESIAKCDYSVDPNKPLTIMEGDVLCNSNDGGHGYGKKHSAIVEDGKFVTPTTLFNDGTENEGCHFDWDGAKNIVAQTGKNFAESFYGANSNPDNHAPGYKGAAFLS